MTRFAILALMLAALAGCAAPKGEMSAPVMEFEVDPEVADPIRCAPDDGIGGTGCPAGTGLIPQ